MTSIIINFALLVLVGYLSYKFVTIIDKYDAVITSYQRDLNEKHRRLMEVERDNRILRHQLAKTQPPREKYI
jgi:hypothetical protein